MITWIGALWTDLVNSWPLLGGAWIAGWLVAGVLAVPGVVTVAREQIFIGAAVAQAATCGVAIGFTLLPLLSSTSSHLHGARQDFVTGTCALIAGIGAALLTSSSHRSQRGSPESRTGWIFLLSASVGVLLLTASPYGANEVARLVTSSILGATDSDVGLFVAVTFLTGLVTILFRNKLVLLAVDPSFARLAGMRRGRWEFAIAVWIGLIAGLAIRVSGLLYVFGCLVLPALAARNLCREVRNQFWVAPLLAIVVAVIGFTVANHHDLPPAQVTIALLAGILPLAWLLGVARNYFIAD
jgi:zinc transport system permease protein